MNETQLAALLAVNNHVIGLNTKAQAGDTAAALEALAELRLATTELKRILTHE